nr:guanine nucleotide exchange factor DBS-like [Bactrocera oleae]
MLSHDAMAEAGLLTVKLEPQIHIKEEMPEASQNKPLNFPRRKVQTERSDTLPICQRCKQVFFKKQSYSKHVSQSLCEIVEYDFKCSICPMSFTSSEELQTHEQLHRENMYFCHKYCGKYFDTIELCEVHEYMQHEYVNYICNVCSAGFASRDLLFAHMPQHRNQPRYDCPVCRLWFHTGIQLHQHRIQAPYFCGKFYRRAGGAAPTMPAGGAPFGQVPPTHSTNYNLQDCSMGIIEMPNSNSFSSYLQNRAFHHQHPAPPHPPLPPQQMHPHLAQQQQHLQRTGSISSNNTTPAHRAATPTKTQQQIATSNNSNGGINSNPVTAQSVSYATEALVTLRPQTQTPQQQQQLPAAECINSLLEHISPAAAAAAMSGEGVLNIADVADLLHPQHAIITGGRSHGGCPLIIFPDNNNFNLLEEADYQKLILYLTSVPSLQDTDLGFQLIIDRRKDKWTSVKTALQRISIYFPGVIHVVYVLRPSGLFQKAISEVSTKFSKDEYRFRLVVCSALTDLHEYIDKSQLTVDMGGSLIYSHHEWIQQRISLEKFSSLTHQVSTELDIFIQTIHDTEFPNSVEATQKLIDVQGSDYERLKEEILAAAKHGETLLNNIKGNEEIKEFSERTGNVSAIERLLVQLEETERRFDEFWRTHRNRLQQCLELRRFEQDFRELQTIFDAHLKCVAEMTEIGESVERVDTLMADTKHYQELSRVDIERAGEVISAGQQLLGVRGVYPWEIVQPKCDELQRVCDIISERLCKRVEILGKNRELMERVEKANQWCANGVELLASQRIEKCSASPEIAEQSLQEIQAFIASAAEFKLSSPSEFKKIFLESTTPETKALVSQVLQRIDDVSLMCDKRIASLKKLAVKPQRPVQTVTPEPAVPLQPQGGAPHLLRRKHKADLIHEFRPRSMDGVIDSSSGSLNGDTTGSSPR